MVDLARRNNQQCLRATQWPIVSREDGSDLQESYGTHMTTMEPCKAPVVPRTYQISGSASNVFRAHT